MARGHQALASKFERPAHAAALNVERPQPGAVPDPLPPPPDAIPRRVLVQEHIGWMDNGCLRQFHEDTVVSNPADIGQLIQHRASLLVIEP